MDGVRMTVKGKYL